MLGVFKKGMKKLGDWIEKTFGTPDMDEEIEKLFMEDPNEKELENVITETDVEKCKKCDPRPLSRGSIWLYLLLGPYWFFLYYIWSVSRNNSVSSNKD